MSRGKKLTVQWEGETVGYLAPHRRGRVTFAYAPEWLEIDNQPVSLVGARAKVTHFGG